MYQGCVHGCVNTVGSYTCGVAPAAAAEAATAAVASCEPGFAAQEGGGCVDIDECLDGKFGCSHTCVNTPGSAVCQCPGGFRLLASKTCQDINECLEENGGCSHTCVNVAGSMQCACPAGYRLLEDRVTCEDVDECESEDSSRCKGQCVNTLGSYSCQCPKGYRKEGDNCIDVNECLSENGGCEQICINLPGSFTCDCYPGFKPAQTNSSVCEDVLECLESNGGCNQDCINTRGSYFCACSDRFQLQPDKMTCVEIAEFCPALPALKNGDITCTEKSTSGRYRLGTSCEMHCYKGFKLDGEKHRSCESDGQWLGSAPTCVPQPCPRLQTPAHGTVIPMVCTSGKTFAGQHCAVACEPGYRVRGPRVVICVSSQQWRPTSLLGDCEKIVMPQPFIQCPREVKVLLSPHQSSAHVRIPQPKTNMDWWWYVDADPLWAKQLESDLPAGKTLVTFWVRSPLSNVTASCSVRVEVVDKEKPRVVGCPRSFTLALKGGETAKKATWTEPTFKDNVEVVRVYKSKEPGQILSSGKHHVSYVASDMAGNKAKCYFTITVTDFSSRNSPQNTEPYKKLVICPGLKPGKVFHMYSYHVPPGCYVRHTSVYHNTLGSLNYKGIVRGHRHRHGRHGQRYIRRPLRHTSRVYSSSSNNYLPLYRRGHRGQCCS